MCVCVLIYLTLFIVIFTLSVEQVSNGTLNGLCVNLYYLLPELKRLLQTITLGYQCFKTCCWVKRHGWDTFKLGWGGNSKNIKGKENRVVQQF